MVIQRYSMILFFFSDNSKIIRNSLDHFFEAWSSRTLPSWWLGRRNLDWWWSTHELPATCKDRSALGVLMRTFGVQLQLDCSLLFGDQVFLTGTFSSLSMNGFFQWWSAGTLQVQQMAGITDITFLFSFLPVPLRSFVFLSLQHWRLRTPRSTEGSGQCLLRLHGLWICSLGPPTGGTGWNWLDFGHVPRHAHDMPMTCPVFSK